MRILPWRRARRTLGCHALGRRQIQGVGTTFNEVMNPARTVTSVEENGVLAGSSVPVTVAVPAGMFITAPRPLVSVVVAVVDGNVPLMYAVVDWASARSTVTEAFANA